MDFKFQMWTYSEMLACFRKIKNKQKNEFTKLFLHSKLFPVIL